MRGGTGLVLMREERDMNILLNNPATSTWMNIEDAVPRGPDAVVQSRRSCITALILVSLRRQIGHGHNLNVKS